MKRDPALTEPLKAELDMIRRNIELQARLFDPFEQGEQTLSRRYGGLGLGLSISRTLAQMHGGTITAESAGPGLGSTFSVELPTAATSEAELKPLAPPPTAATAPASRIL